MELDEKLSALARAEPFRLLDDRARAELAAGMTVRQVPFGENVFERGDAGDAMYVLCQGKARVVGVTPAGAETTLALLGPGEWFGETALVSDAPRNATVRAAFDLTLLRLEREGFRQLIARHPAIGECLRRFLSFHGIQNFLKQSTAFHLLPAHVLRELIGEMEEVAVGADEVVIREGDGGERLYIVGRGVLEAVHKNGDGTPPRVLGQIGEGEFFGEMALLSGSPRTATVVARSPCLLYALGKRGFERAVAGSPQFRSAVEKVASYRVNDGKTTPALPGDAKGPVTANGDAGRHEEREDEGEEVETPRRRRRWPRRYPHVAQHDESDCAAACLAMVTAYHDVPVGVARLRDMANVDADGATMWSVAQAAEALGFHARGLQMGYEALSDLTLPAIAHWEGYHYIVLYEVRRDRVVVGDPGLSLKRLTRDEFVAGWTGRVLELVPTAKLRSAERIRSPFRRFWPIVRPHLGLIGEVLLASLVLNLLGLGMPLFTQAVIDRVLVNHSVELLNMLLIGMCGVVVFQGILNAVRRLLLVHVSIRADARLIADFLRHVMNLPMKFFDLRRAGDILSRVTENDKVREAITGTIPGAVVDTALATGYAAVMFYFSPKLALVVLATMPPFVILVAALTPWMRKNRREQSAREADAWSTLIESVVGIGTVKALAAEPPVRWKMESQYVQALLASRTGAYLQTASSTAATMLQTVSATALLWFGAKQVMAGAMTVGQLLALAALLAGIIGPALRLVDAWDQLQDLRIAFERLNDVFDARPEQEGAKTLVNPGRVAGHVRFENVTFRYSPNQEKPALAGFSIDVRAGETLAVVGRSGSGKSTLAKLVLGLYRPTQGRVLVDGHDLRVVSQSLLRRRIGVVPQDVFLFSGTIRDNIAGGDPDVPLADVVRAAKSAGAHEFVCGLGMGYDTKVGERGMSLSGGQRQRIAMARALLHDPSILVLDEATSALDTESERTIQASLQAAAGTRTTVIIAHRLSTVRHADRIIVLDAGALVEEGTHDQLVERGGLYANLAGQQLNQ